MKKNLSSYIDYDPQQMALTDI